MTDIGFAGGITSIPAGNTNMSTDLADDHPISFDYTTGLAAADGQMKDPTAILPPVGLENGRMQCTSCHDPHRNLTNDFLLNAGDTSCKTYVCHPTQYITQCSGPIMTTQTKDGRTIRLSGHSLNG